MKVSKFPDKRVAVLPRELFENGYSPREGTGIEQIGKTSLTTKEALIKSSARTMLASNV